MKNPFTKMAVIGVCLALAVLSAPAVCLAQPCGIAAPTGVEVGEGYRLAFLTSATRNGESTDIADYNAFVTAAANAVPELAALETQWFAVVSTAEVDARDNTGTAPPGGVPVYLLNDTLIATSYDDLWDGSIAVPWDYTELCATIVGGNVVWSGSTFFGTADVPLGSPTPTIGSRAKVDQEWIRFGSGFADQPYRIYAISDVLTVPSVSTEGTRWGVIKANFR